MNNKQKLIEEMAREIAKRDCYLYDRCPKEIKHNCISQNPEIMLESSKNYITIATWFVEAGYRKLQENEVILTKEQLAQLKASLETTQEYQYVDGQLILLKDKKVVKQYAPDAVEFIQTHTRKKTAEKFAQAIKDRISIIKTYLHAEGEEYLGIEDYEIDNIAREEFDV